MFETQNSPVRPPLRSRPSPRPTSPPISKAVRFARTVHSMNAAQGSNVVSEAFASAKEMTSRAAVDIQREFGPNLTREEAMKLVSAFRARIVPRRTPGSRKKPQVTAALMDFRAGMRSAALFRKHIPGWEKHNRYRRMAEEKRLMDAIRSRRRRERQRVS
jgi:hypothetical protein